MRAVDSTNPDNSKGAQSALAISLEQALQSSIQDLCQSNPAYADFFLAHQIDTQSATPIHQLKQSAEFVQEFEYFFNALAALDQIESTELHSLSILPGQDKSGNAEQHRLDLIPGDIYSIVGPTGSGKSRLLADIEWLAQKDTPSRRCILLNGNKPDEELMNVYGGKLVSQITQNMNFVLDLSVYDFLMMHAQSQFWAEPDQKTNEVITLANELSGESFLPETPVTNLSGGQSRALMIADVACLGKAPIVLIDEIENAGVNKKRALELLSDKQKIVLMATHDPVLMLYAQRRIVISNGGIVAIHQTSQKEKELLKTLEKWDEDILKVREHFRMGKRGEELEGVGAL